MKLIVKKAMEYQARWHLVMLAMAGWMLVATGSAYCGDIPLPPEVQALIGMKIPPVVKGNKSVARNGIPGFLAVSSSVALSRSGSSQSDDGKTLGLETGVLASGRQLLLVAAIRQDLTTEILDALMLPPDLIDWYFEGNFEYALQHDRAHRDRYFKWYWQAGQVGRFALSESCGANEEDERIIIGLIKQEKGKETCSHYSKRVKLAWLLDKQSGRLKPISTQGLQCHYISEDDCY